ncbi:MAG: hypothetical protein K8T26_17685 [Lentisphaerae bacterium]|nr:hypothetical protein [Lentisphaerota bacterium]
MTRYIARWVSVFALILAGVAGRETSALPVRYVDVTRTAGAKTGASWTDAYTNIWDGLRVETVATEFWIAQGTYSPTNFGIVAGVTNGNNIRATIIGDQLYGGFVGNETALSQRDWAANPTIFSGDINGDNVSDILTDNAIVNDAIERPLFHVTTTAGGIMDGFTLQYGNNVGTHTRHGGALYVANVADFTIRNCIFKNNVSARGGAIAVRGGAAVTSCRIENSLFYNNVCASNNLSSDGAIYTFQASATGLYLTNCSFAANSIAAQPSGLSSANGLAGADVRLHSLLSGGVVFKNCIFWSQTNSVSEGMVPTITYSDVRQVSGTHAGTGNINSDPMFANGTGPAYDLRLLTGSPCIEAGENTGVAAVDLDNGTRIQGTTVDMGAYEKVASSQYNITINGSPESNYGVTIAAGGGAFHVQTPHGPTLYDGGAASVIATNSPQAIDADNRRLFMSWYDGSTTTYATNLAFTHAGAITFTLNYALQHRASLSYIGNGTATMTPADGWTNSGATVSYSAPTPGGGFTFSHWEDSLGSPKGSGDPLDITLTAPTNIVAVFDAAGELVNVQTDPANLNFSADGATYNDFQAFSWTDTSGGPPGHILYATNQPVSATQEWRMDRFVDNFGTTFGTNYTFFVDGAGPYNTTAFFHSWWKLATSFNGAQGSVTTSSVPADAFYENNSVVTLTAAGAGPNFEFSSWSGSISGTVNPTNVTMDSAKSITANFTQIVFVDTTAVGGGDNGTSWASAYTNLWKALDLSGAGLEYRVAAGIYTPTNWNQSFAVLQANDTLRGGYPAGGGATRDWAANPTYISGSAADDGHSDITFSNVYAETPFVDYPLLYAASAGVQIDGFTLQYGANISTHTRYGSALYVNGGNTTLRNCVIRKNWALRGAIAVKGSSTDFIMDNCLVYANSNMSANATGGAGLFTDSCRMIAITNCTFADNHSEVGSGDDMRLHSAMTGPVRLQNSIFWSTAPIGNANVIASSSTNYCDVNGGVSAGTGNLSSDPLFVDPSGGDFRLQGASPAINAGDNAGVASVDLDNTARIKATTVDIGAYEALPVYTVTLDSVPAGVGLQVTADASTQTAPYGFLLTAGAHTISVTSPQSGGVGTQYVWSTWSDAGALSHGISVAAPVTYTAHFTTNVQLNVSAGAGGSVGGDSGWQDYGSNATVTATASPGYQFDSWSGDLSGSANPENVVMTSAKWVTATFVTTTTTTTAGGSLPPSSIFRFK